MARLAVSNLGFAVARAAGQVAVCQTDGYLEGIQVLLLVDEKLWDEGAKAAATIAPTSSSSGSSGRPFPPRCATPG